MTPFEQALHMTNKLAVAFAFGLALVLVAAGI